MMRKKMKLKRRECAVKMRLVPYGGGWTDVYADFGGGELYFILSNVMGSHFEQLMGALYHLSPVNAKQEDAFDRVTYKYGYTKHINGQHVLEKVADDLSGLEPLHTFTYIPWKAEFSWDEEGAHSDWVLEREPTLNESFSVRLSIKLCRDETERYEYTLPYEDLCYAVSNAYTKALKKHGVFGYRSSTYTADVHLRYLLFLKSVALRCKDVRALKWYTEKGKGEESDLRKELQLLLFDM